MNNDKYIEGLLRKFMQAQTSEQEETVLAEFFHKTKDIPTDWLPYKEYFCIFDSEKAEVSDDGVFSNEEIDSFITERHSTHWHKRRWLYAAACILALIAFAVIHNNTLSVTSEQKELIVKSSKKIVPAKEVYKIKATSIAKEEYIANLVSKRKASTKKVVRKGNTDKNGIRTKKENVPVPQPAVTIEAKKYLASSEESVIKKESKYVSRMKIEESISYIKSRGEKLERQVLASRSGFGHHLSTNNNID